MFKKAFILFFVIVLASSVFAVRLVDPISQELSSSASFVGSVAPGNTIELVFSKELTNKYDSLVVVSALSNGFSSSTIYDTESIKLFITAPSNAVVGDYPLTIKLLGPSSDDTVKVFFSVVVDSLDVSPSSIAEQKVFVDSPAEYTLFFVNNTDSDAKFLVSTDLSASWVKENFKGEFTVPRRQSSERTFSIIPRLAGKKEFTTTISYAGLSKEFVFGVDSKPTLKNKFTMSSLGLPFFSFSLLPSYFLGGIVSFVFN
ncbi:MAG: hypothetical protein NTY48_02470 [Candidatus Diapherotrites archaeon]|nr:hypothetical protein [Candidatus Diapherotrites archaeon]